MLSKHFRPSKPQPRQRSSPHASGWPKRESRLSLCTSTAPVTKGVNEDIKCYATEDYVYEESEAKETNFSCLQEHFEELFLRI
jgi:hypothetical protein